MITEHDSEDWEHQSIRLVPESAAPAAAGTTECHYHPGTDASFRCAGCGNLLCEECAPEKLLSGELVRFCAHCGGVCSPLEEERQSPAPGLASTGPAGSPAASKPPPPPPLPEPPPPDRQLLSILIHPFKGLGVAWILTWCVLNLIAWPVSLLLFVPYLWNAYLAAEHGKPRMPAPWRLGGGPGRIAGRWVKLAISPGLPLLIYYAVLFPSIFRISRGGGPGDVSRATGIVPIVAFVVLLVFAGVLPLMLSVLFRTGSPFMSLDPGVMFSLIRRSASRYVACVFTLVVLGGFTLGLFLLLRLIPYPAAIPTLGLPGPPPAVVLAVTLGLSWAAVALGRYGQWVSWILDEE